MLDLNKLKICEFNVENLFVHMDMYCGEELQTMSEDAWKALTVIQFQRKQKPLFKIFGVAKAILDIDPDILMLCEVGGLESLENFNQYFLGNKYDIYFEESNSIRTIDLAYLVRKGLPVVCSIKTNKDEALIVNTQKAFILSSDEMFVNYTFQHKNQMCLRLFYYWFT
jgi:hypothetical protein